MNGRPSKYLKPNHTVCVVDLIPEDGTGIRFKELEARCKEHKISYRILRQELKRLEDAGTVIRDAVKLKRGAGTAYRRVVGSRFTSGATKLLAYDAANAAIYKDRAGATDKDTRFRLAARELYTALGVISLVAMNELLLYHRTSEHDLADRRLDSALRDFIVPMFKRITNLSFPLAGWQEEAGTLIEAALQHGLEHWDEISKNIVVSDTSTMTREKQE